MLNLAFFRCRDLEKNGFEIHEKVNYKLQHKNNCMKQLHYVSIAIQITKYIL